MKKTAIAILCCMIVFGAWAIHAVWSAYPGPVGQIGTDNWVQTSPLNVNVSSGTMSVFTVNGGTAAIASFYVSGGTIGQVTSLTGGTLGQLTSLSGGTLGQLTSGTVSATVTSGTLGSVTVTSGTLGAVTVSGGTLTTLPALSISSGTLTSIPNLTVSSGTVTTTPLAYATALGAYNVTAGTAATGVSGGTATTIPAGSRTVTVWTLSGSSNLLIGGGTVTLPSVPIRLDISGGTMGFQSGSGTATVGAVFGG